MAKNKTTSNQLDVMEFLDGVLPEKRSREGHLLNKIFMKASGEKPRMWGPNIVGYGTYHYTYKSGREGDLMRAGFSPRKARLSVYIMGNHDRYKDIFAMLGKYKVGKSCVI